MVARAGLDEHHTLDGRKVVGCRHVAGHGRKRDYHAPQYGSETSPRGKLR
jgi:hypothetical protein